MRTRRCTVVGLLYPNFDALDVAGFVHVLSVAGKQWNFRAFDVQLFAATRDRAESSQLISAETRTFSAIPEQAEVVFIPGGYGVRDAAVDPFFRAALLSAVGAARRVAAVGSGQLLLAHAGLFGPRPACATGAWAEELARDFPELTVNTEARWLESNDWLLAAQSAASITIALELVRAVFGDKLASLTAASIGVEVSGVRVAFR